MTAMSTRSWDLVVVLHNSESELIDIWTHVDVAMRDRVCAVDNGSSDASVALATSLFPKVVEQANLGLSAGNNAGLRATQGRYVLFLNPDVSPTLAGLAELQSALEQAASLIAPRLVDADGSPQANARGLPFLFRQAVHRLLGSNGWSDSYLAPAVGPLGEVPWLLGAAIAGRRDTFETLGGWPEEYFLYYEDVELCLRAWETGVPVRLLEDVRWTHTWARASRSVGSRTFRLHLRSAIRFFRNRPRLIVGLRPTPRRGARPSRR